VGNELKWQMIGNCTQNIRKTRHQFGIYIATRLELYTNLASGKHKKKIKITELFGFSFFFAQMLRKRSVE